MNFQLLMKKYIFVKEILRGSIILIILLTKITFQAILLLSITRGKIVHWLIFSRTSRALANQRGLIFTLLLVLIIYLL